MKLARTINLALFISCSLLLTGCGGGKGLAGDSTGQLGVDAPKSKATVYIELGKTYLNKGQVSQAFKNARKAVDTDPDSASAHNLLGVIYQRLGEEAAAGEHFEKAVQLEPQNPYVLNALASYRCGQREFAEADKLYKRALDNPLYPTPWFALHNAGLCAEEAAHLADAETHFRKALVHNPRFAPSLLRMSQLSFDRESYLSARAYLQRYSAIKKHTAASLWLGVLTEDKLGDKDQVASYKLKIMASFPDSEQARYLNGAK